MIVSKQSDSGLGVVVEGFDAATATDAEVAELKQHMMMSSVNPRPRMNVLTMWPPHVPSYFNAGHHLGVFLTAAYLRTLPEVDRVMAIDAGVFNYTWKEIGELLYRHRPDVMVVVNDFDNIDDLERLLRYARHLVPGIKVITGGRLSYQAPRVFIHYDLDAIIEHGDLEAGAAGYLRWLSGTADGHPGVRIRTATGWSEGGSGKFLLPEEWRLPDVTEIPYAAYDRMYRRDENKFCGIPERRELVVPAARGCPINCSFCEVPSFQGLRDRRLSVERVVSYIEDCFSAHPFEYIAFYAPTFTLNRRWTEQLCQEFIERGARYPWKCATTIAHLDEDLLRSMAQSGCVRVSVGVETLEPGGQSSLPRPKQTVQQRFHQLADSCRALGIELNCFVIVGLPGTSVEGTARTFQEIRAVGGRVRPTMYSSLKSLQAAKTPREATEFNRQLMPFGPPGATDPELAHENYGFIFGHEDRVTSVMHSIPKRSLDIVR